MKSEPERDVLGRLRPAHTRMMCERLEPVRLRHRKLLPREEIEQLLADAITEIERLENESAIACKELDAYKALMDRKDALIAEYTEAEPVRWEYKSVSGWHEVSRGMAEQQNLYYGTKIRALIVAPKGDTEE